MALTDLERLRLLIADRPKLVYDERIGVGDAVQTVFVLEMVPIVASSEVVTVSGVVVPNTDYTLDDATGLLTFNAAPALDAPIGASYSWTVFSDDELNDLLVDQGLTLTQAAIQAIRWLLADTDRFIKYTFGQESVDRSASRDALQKLLDDLVQRNAGGVVSLVKADTDCRKALMAPFLERDEDCVA